MMRRIVGIALVRPVIVHMLECRVVRIRLIRLVIGALLVHLVLQKVDGDYILFL